MINPKRFLKSFIFCFVVVFNSCLEKKDCVCKSLVSLADTKRIVFNAGCLWIAGGGITQYDLRKGEKRKYLAKDGLASNALNDMAIDRKNRCVWAVTAEGFSRMDLRNNQWKSYGRKEGLEDPFILSLAVYYRKEETYVFIGTQSAGLYQYDERTEKIALTALPGSLPDPWVSALAVDGKQGYLWIGTAKGISRYNLVTCRLETENVFKGLPIPIKKIAISEKTSDLFCLSYHNELYFYDFSAGSLRPIDLPWREAQENHEIFDIFFDDSKEALWISSESGINVYNIRQKEWVRIPVTDRVFSLARDNQSQILYYSTVQGIWSWTSKAEKPQLLLKNTPPYNNTVNAICVDEREKNIWIGTDGGIAKFQKQNSQWDYLPFSLFPGERVLAIFAESEALWIGTMYHGLCRMDRKTGMAEAIEGGPSQATVTCIIGDEQADKVWYGIWGTQGGVYEYDTRKKTLKVLPGLNNFSVTSMVEDQSWVWVGTNRGVARFNRWDSLSSDPFETNLLFDDVLSLANDYQRNKLWITTEHGIIIYDKIKNQYEPFTASGIFQSVVTAILFDGELIWFGTESEGLKIFDPSSGRYYELPATCGTSAGYIISLAMDRDENCIWAGTVSAGIKVIKRTLL